MTDSDNSAPRAFGQTSKSFLFAILGILVPLAAVMALVAASARIAEIADASWRAAATAVELGLGVFWLLGAVYAATHFAVIVFARPAKPDDR